jgi:hypothetical protein
MLSFCLTCLFAIVIRARQEDTARQDTMSESDSSEEPQATQVQTVEKKKMKLRKLPADVFARYVRMQRFRTRTNWP